VFACNGCPFSLLSTSLLEDHAVLYQPPLTPLSPLVVRTLNCVYDVTTWSCPLWTSHLLAIASSHCRLYQFPDPNAIYHLTDFCHTVLKLDAHTMFSQLNWLPNHTTLLESPVTPSSFLSWPPLEYAGVEPLMTPKKIVIKVSCRYGINLVISKNPYLI